jgi:hypothetical protein
MSSKQIMLTREERINFILAGDAVFTLRSKKTDVEFKYRVTEKGLYKKEYAPGDRRFVYVKVNDHWEYIGTIFLNKKTLPFNNTVEATFKANHVVAKGFAWMWYKLIRNENFERAELIHIGKCGRCGRKLLDPASLKRGLGPICNSIIRRKSYVGK